METNKSSTGTSLSSEEPELFRISGFTHSLSELLSTGLCERSEEVQVRISPGEINHHEFGNLTLEAYLPHFLPQEVYIHPIPVAIQETMTWLQSFLQEHRIIRKEASVGDKLLSICRDMCFLTSFGFPKTGTSNGTQSLRAKLFCAYCVLGIHLDDVLETTKVLGRNAKLNNSIGKICAKMIRGEYSSFEDIPKVYPFLSPTIFAFYSVIKQLREILPNFNQNQKYFVQAVSNTFTALGILQNYDTLECQKIIPEESFKMLRKCDGAVIQLVEMWLLVVDVEIPESLRSHFLFQAALESCAAFSSAANELVGIRKDLMNTDLKNLIVYRALHCKSMSIEAAYIKRNEEALHEFNHFLFCSNQLKSLYSTATEAEKYPLDLFLFMLGFIIDTHGHLLSHIERYQDTEIVVVNPADNS